MTKKDSEKPKTPKETPTFWDYFPFSLIKDFMNWLPKREIVTKERTKGYLLLILFAVVMIQALGMNLAENTAPRAKSFDYSSINDPNFELKNIVINYNIINIDNTRFDLIRPTERLHAKFSIINHNSTELLVKYNERSFVGGSFIENLSIDDKKVPANETLEFSRLLYLKEEGINSFYFDFTIHNATFTKYGFLSDDSFVGKETLQRSFRVYSSEDYNFRTNQYWVYYFLGPIALPLILLGARAFKEIIEDKSKKMKP